MPYIKPKNRTPDVERNPREVGELNYAITILCKRYVDFYGHSYFIYNDIIGALECVKQEFYRRLVIPYEDRKIKENGDVYDARNPGAPPK